MKIMMEGVREYCEEMPVEFLISEGRPIIVALNQGGNDSTEVDLLDLITWLRANRPELLCEWTSVKERKPPEDHMVLTTHRTNYTNAPPHYSVGSARYQSGNWLGHGGMIYAPTYWMPFPPPKIE